MVSDEVKTEIGRRLRNIEEQERVHILLAVESGSRAWGFASPNSDYDVRFIYAREKDWYVAVDLEEKRDVIEYPIVDEMDVSGWDVRKSLRLFWKSNPSFVEWIQSPITYMEAGQFRQSIVEVLPQIYSVEKGIYHYRSMAKTNYRGYLRGETVPLKKYFYVLRPLLAVKWLEAEKCAAPIEFHRLLQFVDDIDVLDAIHDLLEKKKVQKEKERSPAVPVLNRYIEEELNRLETINLEKEERTKDLQLLNGIFHQVLEEQVSTGD